MHDLRLFYIIKQTKRKQKNQTIVALYLNKYMMYSIGFESLSDIEIKKDSDGVLFYLARLEGFEPPTSAFVVRYSIQLS